MALYSVRCQTNCLSRNKYLSAALLPENTVLLIDCLKTKITNNRSFLRLNVFERSELIVFFNTVFYSKWFWNVFIESELSVLQNEVSKKQDLYDAQGFDGKRHVYFFEIQKKELLEKLENKRLVVEKLQDRIWETEIERRKFTEKVRVFFLFSIYNYFLLIIQHNVFMVEILKFFKGQFVLQWMLRIVIVNILIICLLSSDTRICLGKFQVFFTDNSQKF